MRRPRVRLTLGAVSAVIGLCTSLASAQGRNADTAAPTERNEPAAARTTPRITPPVPLDTSVPPVDDAAAPAVVVLELVVGPAGQVTSVTPIAGAEPFTSIATRAANGWRFSPALADGRPVAARIRFSVRFDPRPGDPSATRPSSPTSGDNRSGPSVPTVVEDSPPTANEVTVRGSRAGPAAVSLSRVEVEQLPGALGDPFRAIESLPGVTPIVSGLPYFFIRGAPPGNIGYFLDGVRIPLLFHLFFGPSIVHPALIDGVDLYRGAAPARFGRFAGAVVSADIAPFANRWRGEAQVRLFDAGALVEAPFADGRGHAIVAGRYSYTAAAISLLSNVSLAYWDYQALVSYDVTDHDRIGLLVFGARDELDTGQQGDGGAQAPDFHRIDLRYDRKLGGDDRLRVGVTFGRDWTGNNVGSSRDVSIAPRLAYHGRLGPRVTLDAGADASFDSYDFTVLEPTPQQIALGLLFPTRNDSVVGAHAELTWQAEDGLYVSPGIRVDRFASLGDSEIAVDPRISAQIALSPSVRAIHTFGIAHQTPNFVPGVPAVQLAGLNGGLQRAWQASSGVETDLPDGFSASATVFDSIFENLTDPLGIAGDFFAHAETASIRAVGSSYGLELSLRRSLARHLGGFVNYTLSRTTRSHDRIHTLASTDRTHVLNAALAYDLGRRWRFGARSALTSGIPAQHIDTRLNGHVYDGYGRAPPFFRLDLRLEKRWIVSEHASWAFTVELFNATLASEITSRTCTTTGCYDDYLGPVTIPSIGIEGNF